MNLENLRRMLRMRASIDCVAFADGQFAGPDSLGAFDRLAREREAESVLVEEILRSERSVEDMLREAMEAGASRDYAVLARRTLARRLHAGFEAGGKNEAIERARNHRLRLKLWRQEQV
jgi:hypothetical protein